MDYERAYGWKGNTIYESEMALFSECMLQCARKALDTADIVREAMFRQLTITSLRNASAYKKLQCLCFPRFE